MNLLGSLRRYVAHDDPATGMVNAVAMVAGWNVPLYQAYVIAIALGISSRFNLARFETLQAYYSVAGRDLERELGPLIEHEKMGLLVWSPLAGALLSGKFSRENQNPEGSRHPNSISRSWTRSVRGT